MCAERFRGAEAAGVIDRSNVGRVVTGPTPGIVIKRRTDVRAPAAEARVRSNPFRSVRIPSRTRSSGSMAADNSIRAAISSSSSTRAAKRLQFIALILRP
jgi:hypothetical protein